MLLPCIELKAFALDRNVSSDTSGKCDGRETFLIRVSVGVCERQVTKEVLSCIMMMFLLDQGQIKHTLNSTGRIISVGRLPLFF